MLLTTRQILESLKHEHALKICLSVTLLLTSPMRYSSLPWSMPMLQRIQPNSSSCLTLFSVIVSALVFIQKGRPFGHAVIVVDMCLNKITGKKLYMLAQSYMPAQETQILVNRNNKTINPWYELKKGDILTPEWNFIDTDLRRFR